MTTPVATATVRILPDTTGFRAALEAEIALATKGLSASISTSAASGLAGTATAAGTTSKALKGVKADTVGAAQGLGQVEKASLAARLGLVSAEGESNALRGALIGLSRVTPVTVFGLGAAGTAGIALGLAIKGAISETAAFDHQLAVFQVTTGATVAQMKAVREEAKALGGDLTLPGVSAGQAAEALTELAKGGLSVRQSLDAARGTLQLATAAQISVGQAADYVVTELNAFGLAGNQAIHIADLLAGASIAAQGSIVDFGTAFQQVSAVARETGLTVEQTTGALTELAKAGLRGADGGTSLRTTLLRLTPTTKQATEFQQALGIQLDKNLPIGKQLNNVIDQYRRALSALTPIQQQQALAQIFGQDAIRAATILIRGGSEALDANTRAANQNGAANRLAQGNAKGLSGAFAGLSNSLSTLGITLGDVAKGPLTKFINQTSNAITYVDALAEHAIKAEGKLKHLFDSLPGLPALNKPNPNAPSLFDSLPTTFEKAFGSGSDVLKVFLGSGPAVTASKAAIRGQNQANNSTLFTIGSPAGLAAPGNLDLNRRQVVHNPDGSISTEESISLSIDGREVLIPTVFDGKHHTNKEAIDHYFKTKQNLGSFTSISAANAYAQRLHDRQAQFYRHNPGAPAGSGDASLGLKPLTAAQKLAERRAVVAAIARAKIKKANKDTTAPLDLQNADLQAQLNNNLKQELTADKAIESYFADRLKTAVKGTARYTKILAALVAAHAQTTSVQAQITSNAKQARDKAIADAKQAAADAKAAATALFNLQKSGFDLAIQQAGQTPGTADDIAANQAEVGFFQRQIARIEHRRKLTVELKQEIINDRASIQSLQATITADQQAQAQALTALVKSTFDLAIQRAGLTKGTADDIRANNAEINFFKRQIARIEAIKKHRKLTLEERQAIVDDQSAIASLQAAIQGIKQQNQGGFTAGDLFKEAASEFAHFGSNIASRGGLLSGQDARASFAARVLNKASAQQVAKVLAGEQAQRDKAQLTEAQKQTVLLRGIYDVLGGRRNSPKPTAEAIHRARELARSGVNLG